MEQQPPNQCLAFAGLGAMGFGMATHLLRQKHQVVGFDVWKPTLDRFREKGGQTAAAPQEAAKSSNVFICMVANAQQVNSVLFDESSGAAKSLPQHAQVLICSTIPAAFIVEVEEKFASLGRKDVDIIDCPVSGGTIRAADGTLTILAAGRDEALRRADPILKELSEKLYVIPGGLGAASNVKMINQLLVGSHIATAAEAMGLAAKSGLNTQEVYDTIRQATGNSWAFNNRVPHMLENDWKPLSALNIFVKDMGIVTSAARLANFPVPIASTAEQQYLQGAARGFGREDDSGVVRVYLPETPSAIHEHAKPETQGAELTPTVTPTEISKIGLRGPEEWCSHVEASLSKSAYSVQRQAAGAQILLLYETEAEDALFGSKVVDELPPEAIVVLTSNLPPPTVRSISARLDGLESKTHLVEAPSISRYGQEGQILLCSGDDKAIATVAPILSAISGDSKNVARISGGRGAAATVRMINSMLEQVHLVCAAEAIAFAAKVGLNVQMLFKIIVDAAGWSWMFESRVPAMLGDSKPSLSRVEDASKSLGSFCAVANSLGYPAAMANAAHQILTFTAASSQPHSVDAEVVSFYKMAGAKLGEAPFEPRKYESLPAKETLAQLPPEFSKDVLPTIQQRVRSAEAPVLVMLDDDPTGTQTCHDIAVLTVWDHDTLCEEFKTGTSGFFILTNSRAFPPDDAYDLILTIAQNVQKAAKETGKEFEIVLRGDSTLRGHLPQEPEAVEKALGKFDGWIVAPFFFQGGRYTIEDVHYVQEGDILVPAGETQFAKDASFGYRSSNLRDYIQEKGGSRFKESDLFSITLEDVRVGGPDKVAQRLLDAPKGGVIIVNAAAESDMFVFAAGLLQAEQQGKRFLYRTGAAFVSARLGIEGIEPLTMKDMGVERTDKYTGGLVVAGSYVPKTTAQLERLRERRSEKLVVIELDVEKMISSQEETDRVITEAIQKATDAISKGEDVLVMTSRELMTGSDARASLNIGATVAAALVRIVQNIEIRPRYIIAKGGITSSDAATKGLNMKRAMILGQATKGVPLWRCDEPTSRHVGVPYVVFPGNVGSEDTLAEVVERWSFD